MNKKTFKQLPKRKYKILDALNKFSAKDRTELRKILLREVRLTPYSEEGTSRVTLTKWLDARMNDSTFCNDYQLAQIAAKLRKYTNLTISYKQLYNFDSTELTATQQKEFERYHHPNTTENTPNTVSYQNA